MTKIQKIKNLIINLIILLMFSLIGIFAFNINPKIYDLLTNSGKVLSGNNALIVHYISIGQGDAIAINLPDGKVAIIDTGLKSTNVNFTNYLKEKVLNISYDNSIDYLILSHADIDHFGGTLRLLQEYKVDSVLMPVMDAETEYYLELKNYINQNNIPQISWHENLSLVGENYNFNFYLGENFITTNEMSYVVKLSCFNKTFLFTGDISSEVEMQLVAKYGNALDCDVLKVAHHGSKFSSCDAFLQLVTPSISVISCGENSYGHPTSEVIDNLKEIGSAIYRTDREGNIAVYLNEYQNLNIVTGTFKTINMSFKIQTLITFANVVILINTTIIFLKKEKRNSHKR